MGSSDDQLLIWDLIEDAARELDAPMTAQDILNWFTEHHRDVQPNTLRSQIAVAVGNSRSYLNHPAYSKRPPLLWSVGWGRYEPYDRDRHGEPRADDEAAEAEDYILGGFDRESEVSALWEADETTAGDVWRRLNRGETPQQIAEEDGITVDPTYSFINLHNALLDGTVSSSPSVARGVAGRVRKWLKTKPLSDQLRQALEQQEQSLNAVVNDSQASEAESDLDRWISSRRGREGFVSLLAWLLGLCGRCCWGLERRVDVESGAGGRLRAGVVLAGVEGAAKACFGARRGMGRRPAPQGPSA